LFILRYSISSTSNTSIIQDSTRTITNKILRPRFLYTPHLLLRLTDPEANRRSRSTTSFVLEQLTYHPVEHTASTTSCFRHTFNTTPLRRLRDTDVVRRIRIKTTVIDIHDPASVRENWSDKIRAGACCVGCHCRAERQGVRNLMLASECRRGRHCKY